MKPRILMMGITPPEEGGSERHIYEISSRIYESVVLTQKGSSCKKKIELPVLRLGNFIRNISFFLMTLIFSCYLLVKPERKYEIVHIHENLLYLLAPLLRLRYKVIVTVHGITGFSFYDNKFLWFFFRTGLKGANEIISVSLADKDNLDKEFKNVKYIPNGVDLLEYKKIGKLEIDKKITFLGRIHKQKGLLFLLEAFEEFLKVYPDYNLQIIGKTDGDYYELLSKKFRSDKLVWRGFISDRKKIFSELASSKAIVFPSLWEALPWPALLEGLASGRPVIASDLKGMRNVFSDNEIVLVEPGNSKALARELKRVVRDKELSNKLGVFGKKKAQIFSWANLAKRVGHEYESII